MTVVDAYLVNKHAYDVVTSDAALKIATNITAMVYADPETCDEDSFAQCLVDTNAVNLAMFNEVTLWNLFATDCAVDNGCTTPCINQEFNMFNEQWAYDNWEEYERVYNESGCRQFEENLYQPAADFDEAARASMRAVEQVAMNEFQQNQESIMRVVDGLGELAEGSFEDFGCDE